ncbi:DUF397 domain-containing protein [Streptomyces cinnamoneus]|uniref:DUF397 domain-containing protein n=1 Tax=Streptomyces cinnamoneus TaxID=53446 RepID=A0A918TNA7_STRCJ|nr:DUF397 domain-containing protein [Streptomyces cinnamoneus]GHC53810.1 hypothetical protein GCM10010507_32620 [Streptomyces cinnamoneus]
MTAAWRRTSYSDGTGGMCVEVADNLPHTVPVRDSKRPEGPALVFDRASWATFVRTLKRRRP